MSPKPYATKPVYYVVMLSNLAAFPALSTLYPDNRSGSKEAALLSQSSFLVGVVTANFYRDSDEMQVIFSFDPAPARSLDEDFSESLSELADKIQVGIFESGTPALPENKILFFDKNGQWVPVETDLWDK